MEKIVWFAFWCQVHVWCLFCSLVLFLFLFQRKTKKLQPELDEIFSRQKILLEQTETKWPLERTIFSVIDIFLPYIQLILVQWDLYTWYTEIKYREATDDPDYYFKNVKFIDFSIIYCHIYKSKLQKPIQEYQKISRTTVFYLKDETISSAQRSDHDNIFLTRTWTVHISLKIMDFLQWKKGLRIRKNRLLTLENHYLSRFFKLEWDRSGVPSKTFDYYLHYKSSQYGDSKNSFWILMKKIGLSF